MRKGEDVTTTADGRLGSDRERIARAEAQLKKLRAEGTSLRPAQLARQLDLRTNVGADIARLVVMAHI